MPWQYKVVLSLLRGVGRSSDSVRLGLERGFDSGEIMDCIYRNQAGGSSRVGRLIDRSYLNQIGCCGLRGRKVALKRALRAAIDLQRQQKRPPVIVDVASGPATYLVETLAEDDVHDVVALARDLDESGLRRGRELAQSRGVSNIRYERGDALDEASLLAIRPPPTIVVSSGFYEILLDDALIQRSMSLIRRMLVPGDWFCFTTQVNHPQLWLIALLPNRDGQPWIMKNRSVEQVEGWARAAGFQDVNTTFEPTGLFSVSRAR
jgi:SAM-dependent methyltransferase